jgi:glycosyltransferase involved in cell wall biosynthesis
VKILYVTRLFSGLESSFSSKVWSPSGVPTIYRVIEKIDKHHTPRFLFTAKDSGSGYFSNWSERSNKEIKVSGLKHTVYVISGVSFFPAWIGRRVSMIFREIRQLFFITIEIIKFKPEIIYCDHANILAGSILSRVQSRIPVVFRVMGVDGFMRQCLTPSNFMQYVYRWAYKSPFKLVLCTQDGSGVESWLCSALSPNINSKILLNGVDSIEHLAVEDEKLLSIPNKKVIILFVGKLEKYKGCYEFVQSILVLIRKTRNVHALVIGTGSEEKKLKILVGRENYTSYFTFIGALPHEQILSAHSMSDIYVSLNYFGNLSNANLEAIQSNDCMVISEPQVDIGIDIVTSNLLKKSVITTPIQDASSLSSALLDLVNSKKKRERLSLSISKVKKNFLWTWEERINKEIDLLEEVVDIKTSPKLPL